MMAGLFHVSHESDVPIYQQLVDEIRIAIKMGTLAAGDQLPTVLQMAEELKLARGTIKRAYDELEHSGLVEKIQGRGTFVCYRPASKISRKEQAVTAIDAMLDKMAELGFSLSETNIFVNLKLREREEKLGNIKVAVVECNPENLSRMAEQLREIEGVDVHAYLLSSIQAYPYKLGEEMDLVVTTVEHVEYLQTIVSEPKKIARIALRLSPKSISQLLKLGADERVGIMGCSQRFADLLLSALEEYTECTHTEGPLATDENFSWNSYFDGKTAVLVAEGFEKYANLEERRQLECYSSVGKLIRCAYEMDEGSFLYLQEKITRLREKKMM